VSAGGIAGAFLSTEDQVPEHELCQRVQGSRAGVGVPCRTGHMGHVHGEREEGSANTPQPVFAGSERHMHSRSKWH